ncbi:MAG: 1-deoxy-D-xylulose-5-phosphate reductoisomerase [Parasphingorhabdus sp.]
MTIANVVVLGATGSIGDSTLDVLRRHKDKFRLHTVTANSKVDKLFQICLEFEPELAILTEEHAAFALANKLSETLCSTIVKHGSEALVDSVQHTQVDSVVTGIVGAAGLLPTLSAVRSGKRVLIANKEPLVMMGREIVTEAALSGAEIIPLDSEHNALFQCLPDAYRTGSRSEFRTVRRILLTGSGGPLRQWSEGQLKSVTPAQAIAHPNWSMGPKISVDSATLMNKGLELIEACCLFSVTAKHVEVVIHPQSTVHSMIEYEDGSIIAQMGCSDMRIPIAHGLGWPNRIESGAGFLDFTTLGSLDFEAPDLKKFPCLGLAREVADISGTAPTILNAANEVAVESFLSGQILFTSIAGIIEKTLANVATEPDQKLSTVLRADADARAFASDVTRQMSVHGAIAS